MNFQHETVLKQRLITELNVNTNDIVIDCTAGGGGHTELLLERVGPHGKVFAFDQDEFAIKHLSHVFEERLKSGNLVIIHQKFSNLEQFIAPYNIRGKISAICADIGISSPQIDVAERGFSFNKEGPLTMTMSSTHARCNASDIINNSSLEELVKIFRDYGEEPKALSIAKAIVAQRVQQPILSTLQLANLVERTTHYKNPSKKHPATRIFQALRIYVNDEINELHQLLTSSFELLAPKGRLGIISFHSLEDRIVKNKFKELSGQLNDNAIFRHLPYSPEHQAARALIIKPFPIVPDDNEVVQNSRARSAKLRVIQKI